MSDNRFALAIDGGRPVRDTPVPPWPYFDDDDAAAVSRVLLSGRVNYWTGTEGVEFEREFAAAHDISHAIALANGTVSLEAALTVLGVGHGDEVIVSPRTFIATASAAVMRGAMPVMADVDLVSQNVTADTIRVALTDRTRAVIVVHLGGWPCDMDAILEVTDAAGVPVIEDCAQALGATYKGRPIGTMGVFGSFSFCQDKIVTTGGEGGMLVTSDSGLWERAWSLKDHGKSYSKTRGAGPGSGVAFRWVHDTFGTNWRMTEMQAVLGRRGLAHLPSWVERRRRSARILDEALAELEAVRVTLPSGDFGHAYYKYYAFVKPERLCEGWSRDRIAEAVMAEGVPCFTGTCPEIYREQAFRDAGLSPAERLPVARQLGETSLMLLVHPTLGDDDMYDTAEALRKVMTVATR
ncbi:MAG: DegT/DnrJ/EryC1/StrS aminotransferase family protein [Coriobacteriia bacterium]|nr:DegT/DnrJ/EryC1/StrS aminotransferase family protein [Coriobacteriia bacterium]